MEKIDYTKVNPNDFTQKDLMLHLLQVSQHTITREDLKDDISTVDKKIDDNFVILNTKIDDNFKQLDKKIDDNFVILDTKIDKLEQTMNTRFEYLDKKIDRLELKFDKLQWLIIAGALVILFKEQILALISGQ